ncbi:MAG TPA: hypothetical protein VFN82_03715 [Solirubrobacterales bacterium]|jgi:hypothetical protein|nr:hypothetical protein [Solirubrobacterales bacterium]
MRVERKQWLSAWLGGAAIGVANGALREGTYGKRLSEPSANRLSVCTASAAFAVYFRALERRWPIRSRSEAAAIGAIWLALTVCFEFGLGRLVAKRSWSELGAEYDVRRGRLWPLVLVVIGLGPLAARAGSAG